MTARVEATVTALRAEGTSSEASTRRDSPAGKPDGTRPATPAPAGGPWDLSAPSSGIAVIGLGNVVFRDDGAGVEAVRRLRARYAIPPDVEVIEGHTAGLALLPFLADAERVVLVDAVRLEELAPGELARVEAREWSTALTQRMTPHDIGVTDLLGAAELSGAAPRELVLWCVQADEVTLGTEMTSAVADAVDALADAVAGQLRAWGVALGAAGSGDGHGASSGVLEAWTADHGTPPTGARTRPPSSPDAA